MHPSDSNRQHADEDVKEVCNLYWLCRLLTPVQGTQAAEAACAVGGWAVQLLRVCFIAT